MTKHECNVFALARAHARNQESEVKRQNSSLFGDDSLLSTKHILLDLAGCCFRQLGRNNRCQRSEVKRQNSSLFGDGWLLSTKHILLDLAGCCFRQLTQKLNSLRRFEVRQMITSVIA
jgi:hypothetical protein